MLILKTNNNFHNLFFIEIGKKKDKSYKYL